MKENGKFFLSPYSPCRPTIKGISNLAKCMTVGHNLSLFRSATASVAARTSIQISAGSEPAAISSFSIPVILRTRNGISKPDGFLNMRTLIPDIFSLLLRMSERAQPISIISARFGFAPVV